MTANTNCEITLEILNKYFDQGKLKRQQHPTCPLYIWNYSERVQYSKEWNNILCQCRALVTDESGNIVARSFNKFFNYSKVELGYTGFKANPSTDSFVVYDKLDGSLGLLFNYKGEWIFSSRGSFTNQQAIKGRMILNNQAIDLSKLNPDLTYNFEIIYPENKIVLDYNGLQDLIFLACFDKNGTEHVGYSVNMRKLGFSICNKIDIDNNIDKLSQQDLLNKEGYVLYFERTGERLKIKFKNYLKIHKIKSNLTIQNVFNELKNKIPFEEIIEKIPDEFHEWLKMVIEKINLEYQKIVDYCLEKFTRHNTTNPKLFAINIKDCNYSSLLFKLHQWENKNSSGLYMGTGTRMESVLDENYQIIYRCIEQSDWFKQFKKSQDLSANTRDTYQNSRYFNIINTIKTSDDPIERDPLKTECIIFDIDGTLALNTSNRSPYNMQKVLLDSPNKPVILMNRLIHDSGNIHIIICTGRSEDAENDTVEWLKIHNIFYNDLYFRPYKNTNPDYLVKEKIWRHVSKDYNIICMYDDRNQVVQHARKLGLTVFQVADGDF